MNYALSGLTYHKKLIPNLSIGHSIRTNDHITEIVPILDSLNFKYDTDEVIDYKTDGSFEKGYVAVLYVLLKGSALISIKNILLELEPGDVVLIKFKALRHQVSFQIDGKLVKFGQLRVI